MNLIKYTKLSFFKFHILYIFFTVLLPFVHLNYISLQTITIISWQFNNNQCLISQLEYLLFNQTLIEYYYHNILNNQKIIHNKFLVPINQRTSVYILFYINLFRLILNINNN